jgi:hypothetical protein
MFRAKYLDGLQRLQRQDKLNFHGEVAPLAETPQFQALVREVSGRPWVVYAKRPFAGPQQVLNYIGRYTHRVALSPRRLRTLDPGAGTVSFDYKDYADGARHRTMTLKLEEFVRRFLLHVLPPRFAKIRHYGLLANRGRQTRIAEVQAALGAPGSEPTVAAPATEAVAPEPLRCPYCREGLLIWIRTEPRPKPKSLLLTDTS